jgi:small-conductance mechanosensitive channel
MMTSLAEALSALVGRVAHVEGPVVDVLARVLAIAVALALAVFAYRAASHLTDRLLRPLEGATDYPAKVQRARTLGPLMKNVARYTLAFVALVVVLREVGVDVQALLMSAGVLGLAVGLGAQSLIKDVITGFFILFEGLIGVGDVIEVGQSTGTVEAIGLRVTKLRMLNGAQRIVPNGELTQFANYNRGWARAVVDVSVGYETDVDRALGVLERIAEVWAKETGLALERPEVQGVVRFGETDLGLRVMVKVEPAKRFDVETQLRRRIKEAFEHEGIPFPLRVVYLQNKGTP